MHLHRPQDQLAGCVWLPRFADTARLSLTQQLPFLYRLAFGGRFGVDGCFLRHFGLTIDQFLVRFDSQRTTLRWPGGFLRFLASVHHALLNGTVSPRKIRET